MTIIDVSAGATPADLLLEAVPGSAVQALTQAALQLDTAAMARMLTRAVGAAGVVGSWDRLVDPALRVLHRMPDDEGQVIAAERILGRAVFETFAAVPRPGPDVPVHVLLACADGEHDTLGLDALAAALAEAGRSCCSLGADTPHQALRRVVQRIRPAVTVVWSQTAATADPAQLRPLLRRHTRSALLVAGPGWGTGTFPAPGDLAGTVSAILAAVRAAPVQPRR